MDTFVQYKKGEKCSKAESILGKNNLCQYWDSQACLSTDITVLTVHKYIQYFQLLKVNLRTRQL